MMMIENACKVSSVLCRGILAIAFCILPLGSVDAQDFNAIERKLEEAIDAGDLSRKDAAIMLNALKRSRRTAGGDKETARGDKGSDRDLEAKKRRYESYARGIEAAIKSGKLSEEAAEKKLVAMRKEMFRDTDEKKTAGDKKKEVAGDKRQDRDLEAKKRRYMAFVKEIEAAVKSGDLSKEAAEKKLISVRREMFSNGDKKPAARKKEVGGDKGQNLEAKKRRYDSYARKIETAVKSGDLSREEAEKKLIEMRKQLFSKGG